jgi:hypothetical protein
MDKKNIILVLIAFLISFTNISFSQSLDEIEQRVNVEIRDTHILIVHLFQSEINGNLTSSGSLMKANIHGQERILAQSVIETQKSLEGIKINVSDALDRVDPDALGKEQGIPWSDHPSNSNEKWTYWIFTDPFSKAKIYFEITYKVQEKNLIFTSYPYDF